MLELYVKINGKFKPLSALAVGPHLKPIQKTSPSEAFKKYIETCTVKKCEKNQNNEILYFRIFGEFLKKHKIKYIHEATKIHIELFEAQLLSRMKVSSVNRRFNTIKHFFSQLLEWQIIHENPCYGLKKKREERNPHLFWSFKDFSKFIKRTSGIYTALFKFLWLTGCRPMEAKNFRWLDINYDNSTLILRCGKNAQVSRIFPVTDQISNLLHSIKIDSLYVFTDQKKQIPNDLLYHYCKTRLRDLGLTKYTVYGLRHSFGTRLAEAGINAFHIANLMGHSKLETTQRYIKIDKEILVKILNQVK